MKNYERRTQKGISELERAMREDLTKLEEHLLNTQEVVEIRGKVIKNSNQMH